MHEAHCHLGLFEKVAASSGLPVGVSMRSKIIKCINSFVQELSAVLDDPRFEWLASDGATRKQGKGYMRHTILTELGRIDEALIGFQGRHWPIFASQHVFTGFPRGS